VFTSKFEWSLRDHSHLLVHTPREWIITQRQKLRYCKQYLRFFLLDSTRRYLRWLRSSHPTLRGFYIPWDIKTPRGREIRVAYDCYNDFYTMAEISSFANGCFLRLAVVRKPLIDVWFYIIYHLKHRLKTCVCNEET
jgi:hypothetical protein